MTDPQKTLLPTAKLLQFSRAPGDYKYTNRVQLDNPGPSYRIVLRWMPTAEIWVLDLYGPVPGVIAPGGVPMVLGAWVRDRTDCLLGVSTPGRPNGAIMSYDPLSRGEPGLDAWSSGGVSLLYVPPGLNPNNFTAYPVLVG